FPFICLSSDCDIEPLIRVSEKLGQDHFCMEQRVVGIHYTRAVKEDIERKGLLIRTGEEIRTEFVQRFGATSSSSELETLQSLWASHQSTQADIRDSRLWFNFTLNALSGSGATFLLGMYGGEQIHMGIDLQTKLGRKLASIGEPLIVRCALDPSKIRTFIQYPWGKILISAFHLSVNPTAIPVDQDGT